MSNAPELMGQRERGSHPFEWTSAAISFAYDGHFVDEIRIVPPRLGSDLSSLSCVSGQSLLPTIFFRRTALPKPQPVHHGEMLRTFKTDLWKRCTVGDRRDHDPSFPYP